MFVFTAKPRAVLSAGESENRDNLNVQDARLKVPLQKDVVVNDEILSNGMAQKSCDCF